VKIPVTDTAGKLTAGVIRELSASGATVNVTAMMTARQVAQVLGCIAPGAAAFVSLFAGRVADTGVDPEPVMREAMGLLAGRPEVKLIWASPREVLNIFQADRVGCDIITVAHDLLAKLGALGKDLDQFSLETVRMFRDDAVKTGFSI
jgi:transaldolase